MRASFRRLAFELVGAIRGQLACGIGGYILERRSPAEFDDYLVCGPVVCPFDQAIIGLLE